ncbi:MAG: response regulator [Magnetococcales bacterium]|nr:response regulator [Magnetococcales bacterium]NGZ05004.1 response regulator [Magnetococcales bacterium]
MKPVVGQKSLKRRLRWRIGSLFVLVVGISTILVGWQLQYHLEEESRHALRQLAMREMLRLEERISYLMETIRALTGNHFIVNSLIDPDARRGHLPQAVEDFARHRDVLSLTLVDFDGRPLFLHGKNGPHDPDMPQLRQTLTMGTTSLSITDPDRTLLVVAPIDYYKTTQGAVAVEFDLQAILQRMMLESDLFALEILDERGVLFAFRTQPDQPQIVIRVESLENDTPWLGRLDLDLRLGLPASIHQASVRQALWRFGSLGLLFLYLAWLVAERLGKSIADPILTLCQRVSTGDTRGRCAPVGTGDELEILAEAFDCQTNTLRAHQEALEERVAERTAELVQARQVAENANRAKSEFLANMSHEIRTPLNAVINFSIMLQESGLNARQDNYAAKVTAAGRTLLGIINDILDFSKLEAERLELERTPFVLEEVVGNVAGIAAVRKEGRELELLYHIHGEIPRRLVGDPLRLGQVLTNLMVNAVKFTTSGEVVLKVEPCRVEPERIWLRFEVRDTGIGIHPEQMERLFRPFSQADASTTRRFGGSGLGLVISQRLVGLMGGEIQVASQPGVGTVFWFEIPLTPIPEEVQPTSNHALAGVRVLVVDDNATAREVLGVMLESFGMRVTLVESGSDALARIVASRESREEPFGMVLLDYRMPDMDGLETARRIRALSDLSRQPDLILVTAHAHEGLLDLASVSGFAAHLLKPFNPSMLLEALLEACGQICHPKARGLGLVGERMQERLAAIRGAEVLLIEDNRINQEVAWELLQRVGVRVVMASTGQEGLHLVQERPFDLVLMDIQMPGMDGLETARRLRALPGCAQQPPIVAMTANALVGDREKSLASGMQDHLAKPIDPHLLYEALCTWIAPREPVDVEEIAELPVLDAACMVPDLPGIDGVSALRRLEGNQRLYRRLLHRFRTENAAFMAALRQELKQERLDEAIRLVHTLKGNAATLGMEALQRVAARIEQAWRQVEALECDEALGSLPPLEEALQSVLTTLNAWQDSEQSESIPEELAQPLDLPRLLELLAAMRVGLDEDLGRVLEEMVRFAELVRATPLEPLGEALARSLEEFDTDRALEQIMALQHTIGTLREQG